jgi:hypothetical protein
LLQGRDWLNSAAATPHRCKRHKSSICWQSNHGVPITYTSRPE